MNSEFKGLIIGFLFVLIIGLIIIRLVMIGS